MRPNASHLLITGTVVAALLAGCSGTSPTGDAGAAHLAPGGAATQEASAVPGSPAEAAVEVYSFDGLVVGASAPNPDGPGPAAEAVPVAKEDVFEVAAGTTDLSYSATLNEGGAGHARIDVFGPDGQPAFSSMDVICVGAPSPADTAVCLVGTDSDRGVVLPGTYTVRYYVAGAFTAKLSVEATAPA